MSLAIELRTANILREIGLACADKEHDLTQCSRRILEGALRITGAPKGNIQLFNPSSGAIEIAVHRGFEEPFLKFFAAVRDEPSMRPRSRDIVSGIASQRRCPG